MKPSKPQNRKPTPPRAGRCPKPATLKPRQHPKPSGTKTLSFTGPSAPRSTLSFRKLAAIRATSLIPSGHCIPSVACRLPPAQPASQPAPRHVFMPRVVVPRLRPRRRPEAHPNRLRSLSRGQDTLSAQRPGRHMPKVSSSLSSAQLFFHFFH